jgi:hypothetical protein
MRKCRIGTAKFFTLLLLLYRTSVKSQGIKQLMAGAGIAVIGTTLVPLLSGLFG